MKVLPRVIIAIVMMLCMFAAFVMLVLPAESLKVDAVYQKF